MTKDNTCRVEQCLLVTVPSRSGDDFLFQIAWAKSRWRNDSQHMIAVSVDELPEIGEILSTANWRLQILLADAYTTAVREGVEIVIFT